MANAVGVNSGYQYLTKYNARNFTKGRGGKKIDRIVIHHWGITGQKFENVINWFEKGASAGSAHYVVEAGRVACVVSPHDTAWHAGNFDVNQRSIGIECRPEASNSDYDTVGELVADIWREWGVLPLYPHKKYQATACPGVWDLKRIEQIAKSYYDSGVKVVKKESVPVPKDPNVPSDWAKESWEKATELGIVDGRRPRDPITREEYAASELRRLKQ